MDRAVILTVNKIRSRLHAKQVPLLTVAAITAYCAATMWRKLSITYSSPAASVQPAGTKLAFNGTSTFHSTGC